MVFINALVVALRNLRKHKTQTGINLLCLSLGFLSLILITLYLDHEMNYDKFHDKAENIYRLGDPWGQENNITTPAFLPNPWARVIADEFPEIDRYTRIQKRLRFTPMVAYNDVRFFEEGFINADSTFFQMFNFKLTHGDPSSALREPGSIVMTESKARKFFGTDDAIGKIIMLDNEKSLRVTGVLQDLPSQSHLEFNYIMPMDSLRPFQMVYSYFQVAAGTDIRGLEAKLAPFLRERFSNQYRSQKFEPKFQQLTEIHLNSQLTYEFKNNGNINNIYLISAIGVLILVIACFNYINIATALASSRLKEFGMRKALGGVRVQLIKQSLVESLMLTIVSFFIALAFSNMLHAPFGDLLARKFLWADFILNYGLAAFIGVLIIGAVAGVYPALILSGVNPVDALRGKISVMGNARFRKILLSGQFTISAVLISGALIITLQLDLLSSKQPGFDRSQVVIVNGRIAEGLEKYMAPIKERFESISEVEKVAFSQTVPGDYSNMAAISYELEGFEEDRIGTKTIFVSHDFVETLGITMIEGRDFEVEHSLDSAAYVVNEAFVKKAGWQDPVGRRIKMTVIDKMEGPVIGVMKDFHFASLHSAIEPITLVILPESFQKILVRVRSGTDMKPVLAKLSENWSTVMPGYPFEFQFMDESFAALYNSDKQFSAVFRIFTVIAILLTCIGLYGLISFEITRRMKEIGIRKISGASTVEIFQVLYKPTAAIIFISLAFSVPITWYFLDGWLSNFAYAIDIKWWHFIVALVMLISIAVLTTGHRIYAAAITNPSQVLRSN
ncbi:MAG TPA: ABC transporter permease [Chryseosolibacter sp.]|nr:ABC transporter permease [Chryseosolibacter sp.]